MTHRTASRRGGLPVKRPSGTINSAYITADRVTGIALSDDGFVRALHRGIGLGQALSLSSLSVRLAHGIEQQ